MPIITTDNSKLRELPGYTNKELLFIFLPMEIYRKNMKNSSTNSDWLMQ